MEVLKPYRVRINVIDEQILQLLQRRYDVIEEVAKIKARDNIPAFLQDRIDEVRENAARLAAEKGLGRVRVPGGRRSTAPRRGRWLPRPRLFRRRHRAGQLVGPRAGAGHVAVARRAHRLHRLPRPPARVELRSPARRRGRGQAGARGDRRVRRGRPRLVRGAGAGLARPRHRPAGS